MFINFTKRALTISTAAVLICSNAYALPPDRQTHVTIVSKKNKDGKLVEFGKVTDSVTPWRVEANIAEIFPNTISQIQNADARFGYIVYPSSHKYGDLSEAYVDVNKYNHAKGFDVELRYPDSMNPNSSAARELYAARYSMIERGVKNAVNDILNNHGPRVHIAIGSFYNPVYFSDESAVAFYTMAGVHEAIQQNHVDGMTKITFLCDGNEKLFESMDHFYRLYRAAEQGIGRQLNGRGQPTIYEDMKSQGMLDVDFKVSTEVDREIETQFFLDHMDRFAELGLYKNNGAKMSLENVVQMILYDNVSNLAPKHVLDVVRSTNSKIFALGGDTDAVIRAQIKKIALKKFGGSKDKAEIATNKIMKNLKGDFTISRIGVYSTILNEKTTDLDVIKKSIERVGKK